MWHAERLSKDANVNYSDSGGVVTVNMASDSHSSTFTTSVIHDAVSHPLSRLSPPPV